MDSERSPLNTSVSISMYGGDPKLSARKVIQPTPVKSKKTTNILEVRDLASQISEVLRKDYKNV